jgi:hypothetical protein
MVEHDRSANLRQQHLHDLLNALLGAPHGKHTKVASNKTSTEPGDGEGDEGCVKISLPAHGVLGERRGGQQGETNLELAEQAHCTEQEKGLIAKLEPRFAHMLQFTGQLTQRTLCHEQARLPPSAIAVTLNPADLQVQNSPCTLPIMIVAHCQSCTANHDFFTLPIMIV